MHMFPSNNIFKEKWRIALRIGKTITRGMMVCSEHFLLTDFHPASSYTKNRHLKKGVVPSLKIPVRQHESKPTSSGRKARTETRLQNRFTASQIMDQNLMLGIPEDKGNTINYTTDFQRICRTCLAERVDLHSIFNDRVNEMLMSFASIQRIVCNDGLPSNICSRCISNISLACNFKQQAENSDNTLRQFIDNLHSTEEFIVSATTSSSNTIEIKYLPSNYDNNPLNNSNVSEEFSIPSNDKPEALSIENTIEEQNDSENEFDTTDNLASNNQDSTDMSEAEDLKTKAGVECCNCNVCFKDQKSLQNHKCPHLKFNEHVCANCGKSFVQKARLIQHMKRHNEEKKHACDQCEKRFFNSKDLMIHQRVHTGEKPINCETCGKKFADPRVLAKHVKIHTGERNYGCDFCEKRFIHSYTLAAHKRTHSGEKPFVCATCGHACSTSTQLTVHMRSHTNERPYFCKLCPKYDRRVKCVVPGCKGPPPEGLMHRIPERMGPRKIWLDIINRPDIFPMSKARTRCFGICSRHFCQSSYRHPRSRLLNIGAVPLSPNPDKNIPTEICQPVSIKEDEEETIVECNNTSPELCADVVLTKTKRTYAARRKNILETGI